MGELFGKIQLQNKVIKLSKEKDTEVKILKNYCWLLKNLNKRRIQNELQKH
jgi:hypothetical protein